MSTPEKLVARRDAIAARDAMSPAERDAASVQIAERVAHVLARRPPGVLGLYADKGSEVGTAPIDRRARAAGWRVAYPRVTAARPLAFHEATLDELVPARMGLREPPAGMPVDIDACVVPGLAFDRAGARIGWGRGHYDATFVVWPDALRIGVAFERQLIERVATEAHDVALHVVVTECAVYEVS